MKNLNLTITISQDGSVKIENVFRPFFAMFLFAIFIILVGVALNTIIPLFLDWTIVNFFGNYCLKIINFVSSLF